MSHGSRNKFSVFTANGARAGVFSSLELNPSPGQAAEGVAGHFKYYKEQIVSRLGKLKSFFTQEEICQEIILNQVDKETKKNILKYLKSLNLKFSEDRNAEETSVMIDLSALNGNKQAMNDLMVYLENEKLKLERKKEKRRLRKEMEAERERKVKEEEMAKKAVPAPDRTLFSSVTQSESILSVGAASQTTCVTRYDLNTEQTESCYSDPGTPLQEVKSFQLPSPRQQSTIASIFTAFSAPSLCPHYPVEDAPFDFEEFSRESTHDDFNYQRYSDVLEPIERPSTMACSASTQTSFEIRPPDPITSALRLPPEHFERFSRPAMPDSTPVAVENANVARDPPPPQTVRRGGVRLGRKLKKLLKKLGKEKKPGVPPAEGTLVQEETPEVAEEMRGVEPKSSPVLVKFEQRGPQGDVEIPQKQKKKKSSFNKFLRPFRRKKKKLEEEGGGDIISDAKKSDGLQELEEYLVLDSRALGGQGMRELEVYPMIGSKNTKESSATMDEGDNDYSSSGSSEFEGSSSEEDDEEETEEQLRPSLDSASKRLQKIEGKSTRPVPDCVLKCTISTSSREPSKKPGFFARLFSGSSSSSSNKKRNSSVNSKGEKDLRKMIEAQNQQISELKTMLDECREKLGSRNRYSKSS